MKERVLSLALCGLCLLNGCQAGEAVQEEIWELEEENAAVFADGQAADRWRGYQDGVREPWVVYQLADGTVLLEEDDIAGPEGSAAYAALPEQVQAAVSAWYQGEGRQYDLTALLEACYARYGAEGETYQPGRVTQWAAATAASEEVVYLTTTVDLALDPAQGQSLRTGAAFDRATGQRLELWSLFAAPEAEVRQALAAAAGEDPAIQARLAEAIDPARVLFYAEHLEIDFPAGTFPEQDAGSTLSVDYAALDGLLTARALPGGTG